MADIFPSVYNWSTTESLNAPLGTAIAGAGIDDNLRAIQAGVKKAVATIGADIPVGATIDLANATGNTINITGTGSSVSSLGTVASGAKFKLIFQMANTLVNSANLVLPGGTNIILSAGDVYEFLSRGSGAWTCIDAQPNITPGGMPIGMGGPWFTAAIPSGFLLAAGQTVNRTIYAALFAVFGTGFNTGGEAGTDFRLPDLRGRYLAGLDNMGGSSAGRIQAYAAATTVGTTGGNENPQQHAHAASSINALGTHGHSFSGSVSGSTGVTNTDHYHSYSGSTGGMSGNNPHSHQNGMSLGAGQGGGGGFIVSADTAAADIEHTHAYSGNTASQSSTGFVNYQHGHSFSGSVVGSIGATDLTHNHGITVGDAGTGASGNLPPVMFVNWIIRAF